MEARNMKNAPALPESGIYIKVVEVTIREKRTWPFGKKKQYAEAKEFAMHPDHIKKLLAGQ